MNSQNYEKNKIHFFTYYLTFELILALSTTVYAQVAYISEYAALQAEVSAATGNKTIILTANITGTTQLTIGRSLTIDLKGYNLTINTSDVYGLYVSDGRQLSLDDSGGGKFNVNTTNTTDSAIGVYVVGSGSAATVTNATATNNGIGAYAYGGNLNVLGNAIGVTIGAFAREGASVEVHGNAESTSLIGGSGALAQTDYATPATVIVRVNVKSAGANGSGAEARSVNAIVTVGGNSEATGLGGIGAQTTDGGSIIIYGSITATTFVNVGSTPKTAAEYTDPPAPARTGFRTYTDDGTNIVWMKETAP